MSRDRLAPVEWRIWEHHIAGAEASIERVLTARSLLCTLPFVLCAVQLIFTHIRVQTSNYTFDPLEDMPANFGPRIPAEGIEGFLIVSLYISTAQHHLSFLVYVASNYVV